MMGGADLCAVRDRFLMEQLRRYTPEEEALLRGERSFHSPYLSTVGGLGCMDCLRMPHGTQLVSVIRHPRYLPVPKHRHNYIEAMYVCSGHATHLIDGKEVRLETGDLLMLNQYTCHEVLPLGEADVAVNFVIQPRFFDDAYELAAKRNILSDFIVDLLRQEVNCKQYLHYKLFTHLPASHLLEIILVNFFPYDDGVTLRENSNSDDEGLNKALMFLVFRYLSKDLSDLSCDAPMNFDQITQVTVMNYIEESYQTATLNELAEIMNQSPSALSRQIKLVSGSTFKELLQGKRFRRAVKLLEETNLAVSDIALAVGYENSSYFYRRFREIYGISPKLYRENARK